MKETENKPVQAEETEKVKFDCPAPSYVHPENDTQATQWMHDAMNCVPYT